MNDEIKEELAVIGQRLMEVLANHAHPHISVVATSDTFEVTEGIFCTTRIRGDETWV